jgi:hypothetical protein
VSAVLLDLKTLSDDELTAVIRDLSVQIAANRAQLEPKVIRRRRTFKLARGTFLTVGGLAGATLDWLALLLTIVGIWDWIDALAEDAAIMNRQLELLHDLAVLEEQFSAAATEFRRRTVPSEHRP